MGTMERCKPKPNAKSQTSARTIPPHNRLRCRHRRVMSRSQIIALPSTSINSGMVDCPFGMAPTGTIAGWVSSIYLLLSNVVNDHDYVNEPLNALSRPQTLREWLFQ